MTRAKRNAYRIRWLLLVAGLLYVVCAICWVFLPYFSSLSFGDLEVHGLLGTPLAPYSEAQDESTYGINIALLVGLLLLAQWWFLRPGRAWTARLAAEGRPLKGAVLTAAAMAMLLTVGAVVLILEVPDWWEPIAATHDPKVAAGTVAAMLLLWGLWAWVFAVYWRQGDRYTQLGRMIRGLVAGSLLEVLVAVPVHIWAARQRECYCYRGSYTTLVLAGVVLLWAFGPGIALLFMRERYRQARLFPMCKKCGYNLTGLPEPRCPECGTRN